MLTEWPPYCVVQGFCAFLWEAYRPDSYALHPFNSSVKVLFLYLSVHLCMEEITGSQFRNKTKKIMFFPHSHFIPLFIIMIKNSLIKENCGEGKRDESLHWLRT